MIKVVTFDLGNVLFAFDPLRAARGFLSIAGLKQNPLEILRFFQESPVERAYTEGRVSTQEFVDHVIKGLKINSDIESFKKCYCEIFSVNSGTFALAEEVRERGIKRFILSNTNELHYDYLCEFYPVLTKFEHAVLSYKEHCQKPQPEIYERLIESAGCAPEEIFFTDDLLENVVAAEKAGIQTHHFKNEKGMRTALIKRKVL
jgi:putative hydrolase of the HAD superfamily